MKLVMTLLVRDEEDIIAANVAYHLSVGVDHVIVMDNLSRDATPAILQPFADRGVLTYLRQAQDDYAQGVWVSEMAALAHDRFAADWVIHSDADEFWWPHAGDLKAALAATPPDAEAVRVERTNFLPPLHEDGRPFAEAMTVRERVSLNTLGRPLPPKVCHRGLDAVVVGQGNHEVFRHGRRLEPVAGPLEILHFPLRSYAQFARKIESGGAAYARNRTLDPSVGETWRRLHRVHLEGGLRAAYDAQRRDEAAVAEGLRSGELVRDERLRDALAALEPAA